MSQIKKLNLLVNKIEKKLVCKLKDEATNLVFGKGNPNADIFFIGEAPGEKEDEQGIPFVGRAGKELDKLLQTIGLTLDDVYIANILKYRPPKNRNPNVEEIKAHTPYLIEQIKIIKPKVIIPMGNFAAKFVLANFEPSLMKKIDGISKLHGIIHKVQHEKLLCVVIPVYHPAAMLYNPKLRVDAAKDFLFIGNFLKEN